VVRTLTSEKGGLCKFLTRGDLKPALHPFTSNLKTCVEPFSLFLLTLKDGNTKGGTGGKQANGRLCALGVRKLVWKSAVPGLQTFLS